MSAVTKALQQFNPIAERTLQPLVSPPTNEDEGRSPVGGGVGSATKSMLRADPAMPLLIGNAGTER